MEKTLRTRVRAAVAVLVAIGALATLSVLAGASWATGSSSYAFQYHGGKATLCHHTHSKTNPWVTITVSQSALKAHLKHGDTLGTCTSSNNAKKTTTTTTTTTASTSTDESTTHGHGGHGQGGNPGHGHSK